MDDIAKIKQLLEQDRPETWEALPDIELYMDQVVSYLTRQSIGGKVPSITSAMINNYVKDGLMPRANGKRYNKEHLVYLTAIGQMKNVLTVKDMKVLLGQELISGHEREFYGEFCREVGEACKVIGTSIPDEMNEDELANMAMRLAIYSFATKTACEHLLALMQAPQEDQKAKKEKDNKKAKSEK